MDNSANVLIGIGVLAVATLAAVTVYKWRQRERVRQVDMWLRNYLCGRYGTLPNHLRIDCSADPLWPVFVAFNHPSTGTRHRLQFACQGPHSVCSLLTEEEEKR